MSEQLYQVCVAAYHHLLQTPHDVLRAKNQRTFCMLRDVIAAYEMRSPQEVQDEYEEAALLERLVKP